MPRLGCGINRAYITDRCAHPRLCDLGEQATEIQWSRRLDQVSEASVIIPVGGTGEQACCECLSDVEPWCHELIIAREDEVVWQGPVTNVEYGYEFVTIEARDVAYWLQKRVPSVNQSFVLQNLSDIAQTYLNAAFAEDDPCVLSQVINTTTTGIGLATRDVVAFSDTWLNYWLQLAQTGLDFTVVNRSIIFGDSILPTIAIGILTDELIMGEVKLSKQGDLAANRWYVNWNNTTPPNTVIADGPRNCYGLLEGVKNFTEILNVENAQASADDYVAATQVAPRTIEFPEGSRISPDCPWTIDQLIPGIRMDVSLTRLCYDALESFRLTDVNVRQTGEGDEEITVTLSPVNIGTGIL